MKTPEFAELCCKTNYTFLVGASHPSEIVERAHELGLRAVGITDRDGVYGIPKAYRTWKNLSAVHETRLRMITGAELTLEAHPRLTLLARDRQGYGLLCQLLTASHVGQTKGEASLSWHEFIRWMNEPGNRGLIALPQGPDARYGELKEIFQDRLYLPVSRFLEGWDAERIRSTVESGKTFGIPLVATNDVHYHVRERRALQDVLTAIRANQPVQNVGGQLFSNAERYLKSAAQMQELLKDFPDAVRRTLEVANSCTFSPSELSYRYPSEWLPEGETSQGYLERLVWKGAENRYPTGIPDEVKRQLDHELQLISLLHFADYFLTIWEIIEFARERKILCQGRGSAANSAVCYCLGITAIDPVRMNLLFERFISVERGEPPDIDVDFEHERREEVIQHLYEKYGRHRAAMVSAVITYRSRSAIRDVRKALGVDEHSSAEAQALAQKIANELYGFPRHLSIHSGGFTLSADPLIETVPVEAARMEGRTIVQWDKDDLDAIGLLKVDVLSLGMLTAIRKTLDSVGMTLSTVPPEDPATYEMIRRADTVGVFQIESRAQMSMLPRLLPRNFYDLVIELALVRPGPIVGKMIHPFLRRRKGLESVVFPDPRLEPILGRTLGVPLFQEQIMKMAIALGGFSPGEADELRRAIGAWRSSGSIQKMGKRLMEGLRAHGLPEQYAEQVFEQIQGFASYGFPESHSASFALLAYASAYLKCHHPAEFAAALINSQPMGFYSNHTLVDDARRHGVRIWPVDPHRSRWDCQTKPGHLLLGWCVVQGMSEPQAQKIMQARKEQKFSDLFDFVRRTELRKNILYRLAMGNAFACFGWEPRQALWELLAFELLEEESVSSGQLNLFSSVSASAPSLSPLPSRDTLGQDAKKPEGLFSQHTEYEAICADYASYGLSTRGHPMQALRRKMSHLPQVTSAVIKKSAFGKTVKMAGLVIVRQRPATASGVTFATLEDETGFLDLIFHQEVREKYENLFLNHSFLVITGKIQRDGLSVSVLVSRVEPVWPDLESVAPQVAGRDFR